MNITKTEEMFIDFRKLTRAQEPAVIEGQTVECVGKYKYLRTIIDSKLTFGANCEAAYKKGNQLIYCLRKLSFCHIDNTPVLTLWLYRSGINKWPWPWP